MSTSTDHDGLAAPSAAQPPTDVADAPGDLPVEGIDADDQWPTDDAMDGTDGDGEPWDEGDWDAGDRDSTESTSLFEGDEGDLTLAQRRCLLTLLKHRFITAVSHPKDWRVLLDSRTAISKRLNEMFLTLHLDTDREVAFKRQATSEGGGRFPTLLHDTEWPREETVLMVYLRTRARADEASGAQVTYVERADMLEHLAAMRPVGANDASGDSRKAHRAIESLHRAGLLLGKVTGDTFALSPALDALLPLERLNELLTWLREQNTPATTPDVSDAAPETNDPTSTTWSTP